MSASFVRAEPPALPRVYYAGSYDARPPLAGLSAEADCPECEDTEPGICCAVCGEPVKRSVVTVPIEETPAPAPVWDTDPRGEA